MMTNFQRRFFILIYSFNTQNKNIQLQINAAGTKANFEKTLMFNA